jgi:DNA-binding response OmpR family regulator
MSLVLVAEDEPAIATSLEFLLRKSGYDTCLARDGEAALALAHARRPQLIVLDLMLPRRNGIDVCRTVRADPRHATLKVMMLTARGGTADIDSGMAAGVNCYLVKPFSTQELLEQVAQLLAPGSVVHGGGESRE